MVVGSLTSCLRGDVLVAAMFGVHRCVQPKYIFEYLRYQILCRGREDESNSRYGERLLIVALMSLGLVGISTRYWGNRDCGEYMN